MKAGSQLDIETRDDAAWLTVAEVRAFERISRRECYNRMRPGELVWKERPGGGRLISVRSMTYDAQQRWRAHALAATVESEPAVHAEHGQLSLLPRTAIDEKIGALTLPRSEKDVVLRRFRIVQLCLNHNWKAEGYESKDKYIAALAARESTHKRRIYDWVRDWKQGEDLMALVNGRPGPPPGTGAILTPDARAHLRDCWTFQKLNVRQCHNSAVRYLETKQKSPGCRVDQCYRIPSYDTVARFIRALSPLDHAARRGPEALKAACGYIDRTYRDLASLDLVLTDEWKCDFFAYDMKLPKIVRRWWLLTFYDARSMFPLVGKLVAGSQHDAKHGIREADEIEILISLLKEYGVPKSLYSDHGRFRGRTFGGRNSEREKLDARRFETFDGILDRLGIVKSEPREKNPRGSRLERFHRYLADQSRTLPGWIGANDKEREMTRGDEQKAIHERWLKGDPGAKSTPLLSTDEAMLRITEWMEAWRDHESKGTDMNGLSPRAVFIHNTPEGGFKRPSDAEIALATAEHIPGELIEQGGIIQLRDGKRYSHPALILIQGERREVVRLRDDHSKISVLPAAKGEEPITAMLRERVAANDPDNLAAAMELQHAIRKIAGKPVEPRELRVLCPGSEDASALPPVRDISSSEYMMERARRIKPLDFKDLEL